MRPIPSACVELVKSFEGVMDGDPSTGNLDPYLCPAGIWTIGWGHAIVDPLTGAHVRGARGKKRACALYADGLTLAQAAFLLHADLLETGNAVEALTVGLYSPDPIFSALVSLAFNIGTGAFATSTLRRKLQEGDLWGASAEFSRWNKARVGGRLVTLPGLTRRREAERQLFISALAAFAGLGGVAPT
jgi:lysozyme